MRTALNTTTTLLDNTIASLGNIHNDLVNRGSVNLFNGSTGVNGLSPIVSLNTFKVNNLTFYGNVDSSTNLILRFSNNGVDFYNSTYSINLTGSGDFGTNITACPLYLQIKSTNDVSGVVYVDYA
jgi:hypothetical protein